LTASGNTDLPYSETSLEDVLVNQLQQADQRACLFCGEPHRCDQCHAFGDKKFVENFLIKIVSTVKRKLRDASRLHGEQNSKPQDARIYQVVQTTVDELKNIKIDEAKIDTIPGKPTHDS
jgi:recombinational DNA repair protein RecR